MMNHMCEQIFQRRKNVKKKTKCVHKKKQIKKKVINHHDVRVAV